MIITVILLDENKKHFLTFYWLLQQIDLSTPLIVVLPLTNNAIAIVEMKQLYVTNKTYIIGKIALILESQNNWVTFYHQYLHSRDSILTINNKIYLIRMVSVLYDGKMVQDPYSVVDQILVCRCRCVSRRSRRRVNIVYIMQ